MQRWRTSSRPLPVLLLVDDDADLRDTLADACRDRGCAVITAEQGAQALHILHSGLRPALIVTDVMMPVMSGAELVARVRADAKLNGVPVVAMSATGAVPVPGATATLAKPTRVDEMASLIETFMRPDEGGRGPLPAVQPS